MGHLKDQTQGEKDSGKLIIKSRKKDGIKTPLHSLTTMNHYIESNVIRRRGRNGNRLSQRNKTPALSPVLN